MGNLLPGLSRPGELELAKAVEQLPGEDAMPGGSRYELKWDGFLQSLPGLTASHATRRR